MTAEEALQAVLSGLPAGSSNARVTLCILRTLGSEHAEDMVSLATRYGCGLDVAGEECSAAFDGDGAWLLPILAAFRADGGSATVHAGEWPGSRGSLEATLRGPLDRLPQRVGHALQVAPHLCAFGGNGEAAAAAALARSCWAQAPIKQQSTLQLLLDSGATVEVCLTSNVAGSARRGEAVQYWEHPLPLLWWAGVPTVLCCDNHVTSGSAETGPATPSGEVAHALLAGALEVSRQWAIAAARGGTHPTARSGWQAGIAGGEGEGSAVSIMLQSVRGLASTPCPWSPKHSAASAAALETAVAWAWGKVWDSLRQGRRAAFDTGAAEDSDAVALSDHAMVQAFDEAGACLVQAAEGVVRADAVLRRVL